MANIEVLKDGTVVDYDSRTITYSNQQHVRDSAALVGKPLSKGLKYDQEMNKKFSHEEYALIVDQTIQQIKELSSLKGGEYAGDEDRLANFRRNAINLGLTMEDVWSVYAAKHWDAIMQYVKDLRDNKTRKRLESIEGRMDDLIVYLILAKAMYRERESG